MDLRYLGTSKRSGRKSDLRYNCPACGDTKFHLYVNIDTGVYHCFHCGLKGKAVQDLRYIQAAKPEVVERVAKKQTSDHFVDLSEDSIVQTIALNYWLSRGFTIEEAKKYNIKVGTENLTIAIPVEDSDGKFVFYQERMILPVDDRKYLFPRDAQVSRMLFSWHRAKKMHMIVLVEGVMDAMALGDVGVALFGKQLHDDQLALMNHSDVKKAVLWLDPDARREQIQAVAKLEPWLLVDEVLKTPPGIKDASEFREKLGNEKLVAFVKGFT